MRQLINDTLKKMKLGERVEFPIERMRSVKTSASDLGYILRRKYRTHTDGEKRVIQVTRLQ